MTWSYGKVASEVYDRAYPVGHALGGDIDYYLHTLAGTEGRILEPAVGTGRVLVPLLKAGFEVVGYDNSSEMLAVCSRNCHERGLDPRCSKPTWPASSSLTALAR